MLSIQEKINHLKKLGFCGDMTEIEKMYNGNPFKLSDPNVSMLIKFSQSLCDEFTYLSRFLINGDDKTKKAQNRRQEIIDILFPGHGPIFGGRINISAIIGLVDFDGMNYINSNIDFGNSSLIHIGNYTFIANDVKFGQNIIKNQDNYSMSKINIGCDTWICAGVQINDNTNISSKSVVSLGSVITPNSNLQDNTIISGNPAISTKTIIDNFKTTNSQQKRDEYEIKEIIKHIKKLGIGNDLSEYEKQLKGEEYNTLDPTISLLFDYTHNLCYQYNASDTLNSTKKKILDELFFMHGYGLNVGNNLHFDLIGTVNAGNNVDIGDNVALCGNITIGDNVTIKNNCLLQAIGHHVEFSGRRLGKDQNGNICEWNVPKFIEIAQGVILEKGTKIAKGKIITNTEENQIIK